MWKIAARQLRNTATPSLGSQRSVVPETIRPEGSQESFCVTGGFAVGGAFLFLIRNTNGVIILA